MYNIIIGLYSITRRKVHPHIRDALFSMVIMFSVNSWTLDYDANNLIRSKKASKKDALFIDV